MPPITNHPQLGEPTADELAGMAWYNTQTEDTLCFWHAIASSAAPIDAWIAYRDTAGNACTPPAAQTAASLPAPAAGQGEGTTWRTHCPQCGELLSVADEPYCAYLGCFWNNEQ